MKIGISNPIANIGKIAEYGFDYMESQLFALMEMDKAAFDETVRMVKDAPIPCPIYNMYFKPGPFVPGPTCMKIVGPDVDRTALADYSNRAADRAAALDATQVIIGNGKSRDIPEGWTKEQAQEDFMKSLTVMGDAMGSRGITLMIEPVRFEETTNINRVDDCAQLVRTLDHPHVRMLADFWHMRMIGEEMSDIEKAGDLLCHAHIARKDGRAFPMVKGEDIYEEFFAALAKIGYRGALSIEGDSKDPDHDAPKAAAFLRAMAAEFGL